jgi:hypothetical protein
MVKKAAAKTETKPKPHCPYCEVEIMELNLPFCQECHVEIVRCVDCLTVIPKGKKACPSCGKKVKAAKAK